tara:strand:+ start:793 stop:1539 length:747 start_codon:yes stop_codon:yes gene_type:complete
VRREKTKAIKKLEAEYRTLEQLSDAWFAARIGRLTASQIGKIIPGKRGGYLKDRETLMDEMMEETLNEGKKKSDVEKKHFPSIVVKAMAHGTAHEGGARVAYELETGNLVEEVGLYLDPQNKRIGASPDGLLMGEPIGLEIKCPYGAEKHNKIINLVADEVPIDDPAFVEAIDPMYRWQMLCQMECMEVDQVDFVSYDPRRESEAERLFIIPFHYDEILIAKMLEEADIFLKELDIQVEKRRKLRNGK